MIVIEKCLGRGCPAAQTLVRLGLGQKVINEAVQTASHGMETYCAIPKEITPGTCGTDPKSEHVLNALAIGVQLGRVNRPVQPEAAKV